MSAANFLQHQITLTPRTGNTGAGDPSYGASSTVKAKFVTKSQLIVDQNGKEVTSDSHVFIPQATTVSPEDKVTYESVNYRILKITDQRGTVTTLKHKKLMLQRTQI